MKRSSVFAVAASLLLIGCDSGSSGDDSTPSIQIQINLDGMASLKDTYQYRIWARVGQDWVMSNNGFNYNESGLLINTTGQLIANTFLMQSNIAEADMIVIGVHGKGGFGDFPPSSTILGGDVSGGSATLSAAHEMALGGDLLSASGTYTVLTLETPADAPANYPKESGIWFGEPNGAGSLDPTLSLPNLSDGWLYGGWLEKEGVVYAIGRFEEPDGLDMDNQYLQPDALTPVPGENFLTNAPDGSTFPLDVRGATVFLTVEPNPDDDDEAPTSFRIFEAQVPASAAAASTHSLGTPGVGMPTGTATIH